MSRSRWRDLSVLVLLFGFAVSGVGLPCRANGLPDLTLDLLADSCIFFVEGSEILQGETVEVQAAVSNTTGVPPAVPIDVLFVWRRIDKEEACGFETLSLPSLGFGRRVEVSASIDTGSLVPGTYEVSVTVDPDGRVAEVDETNNECSEFLFVLPVKPELRPLRLELTTVSPVERGETTGFVVEIENTGDREAGELEVLFELAPLVCRDPTAEEFTIVDVTAWDEDVPVGLSNVFVCDRVVETDYDALVSEAAFVTIGSALVPGLAQGARTTVEQVLDSATQLDELLADLLLADDEDPQAVVGSGDSLGIEIARQLSVVQGSEAVYAIRATIRSQGGLPEKDPDNNAISTYMTIVPSELDFPELRPIEITLTHDTPVGWRLPNGPTVGVTVTVMNVGGSVAKPRAGEGGIIVRYYARRAGSGIENPWEPKGDYSVSQIAIEEGLNEVSAYREIRFEEPGEYQIKAEVDATDVVEEVNENNNAISTGLSVQGTELHPIRVELGAAPISQGDTVEIVSVIENTGRLTAETFTVGFYVDGTRVDTAYYRGGGLAEDEKVSLRGYLDTTDFPASTYVLRVVVDPDGRLADSDRMNNEMGIPFRISAPPARLAELHATGIKVNPPSPVLLDEEGTLTIASSIKNTGSIDSGRFQVEFASRYRASSATPWGPFFGDCGTADCTGPFFCVRQDVSDLARASSKLVQLDCNIKEWPEGLYQIRVHVDPPGMRSADGEVPEQDENNNAMIVGFRIGSADKDVISLTSHPNLVFKTLVVSPTQDVDARQRITIVEAVVRNAGQEAAGGFDVKLCWQGRDGSCVPTGDTVPVEELAGETEIDLAEWFGAVEAPATPGSYQMVGIADVWDEIDERGREGDNRTSAHVQVTGMVKPDLTIDEVWFSVDPPLGVGSSVTAFARVRNLSGEVGAGTFDVRFEQLEGGPVRDVSVERLGPGGALELSFGLSTSSAGDFTLRVTADIDGTVTETDDKPDAVPNNAANVPFAVVPLPAVPVEEAVALGGKARFLTVDRNADIVYAAASTGRVVALLHGDPPVALFDVSLSGGEVVALDLVPGVALYVAVVAEPETIHVLNPATGASEDEVMLPEGMSVSCMTVGKNGTLYVGTDSGVLAIDRLGNLALGSGLTDPVLAMAVDPATDYVYVLTETTLYAVDEYLAPKCGLASLLGTPVSLAVGPGAVYVGTQEGTVSAYALCNGSELAKVWQYPESGTLGSAIAALSVNPEDFDPIYVAVADGPLVALDAFGVQMWTYEGSETSPLSGLASAPVWDGRTGRVFFVDTEGMPIVLSSGGTDAFSIDASAASGVAVYSSLIIDEYMVGTGSGARVVRVYYYGGDDGAVYAIQTER